MLCRYAARPRAQRPPRSLFPSPLWGGVRGGGARTKVLVTYPPSPTLPHKGGGSERASLAAFHFIIVIASEAKQSRNLSMEIVWIASSLTLLAMTTDK
jgi:hypothetical protein